MILTVTIIDRFHCISFITWQYNEYMIIFRQSELKAVETNKEQDLLLLNVQDEDDDDVMINELIDSRTSFDDETHNEDDLILELEEFCK